MLLCFKLNKLQQTWNDEPNLPISYLIFDAKRDEITNTFFQGSSQEKTKAVNIMREVYPSNACKYEKVLVLNYLAISRNNLL